MKQCVFFCLILFITLFSLPAAGKTESGTEGEADDKTKAFVSIVPQKGVVERIGGEWVTIHVLVKPGESPHTYEPSPKQVMELGEADILFTLGFPFEQRLVRKITSSHGTITVFATDRGITHRHLEEHQDDHEGMPDPHVWLGPPQLEKIARNTFEGLTAIDPDHRVQYRKNLDTYIEDLRRIDSEIKTLLTPYRGKTVLVFHPSFGYFCDHYGIKQVHIELEGKSPAPKQLERLIEKARAEDVHIIFVQPQFDKKSAEAVADAIDGTVVSLNPLHEDTLHNLREIAEKIKAAF